MLLNNQKQNTMKNTFQVGNSFKHYNGYVWTITGINGKSISLESNSDGQTLKGSMTFKELNSVINAGYYSPIN